MNLEVEMLESLWSSPKLEDRIEFFSFMYNATSLIDFSRSRRRPVINIVQIHNDESDSIVLVIPTKDSKSQQSVKMSRFFRAMNIIFVESSGPFFNYSLSISTGIKEAMKHKHEWIIISNDDMLPESSPEQLIEELNKTEDNFLVPTKGSLSAYETEYFSVVKRNSLLDHAKMLANFPSILSGWRSSAMNFHYHVTMKRRDYRAMVLLQRNKLWSNAINRMSERLEKTTVNFNSFGMFRSELLRKYHLDNTFVNGCEDYDLSLSLADSGIVAKVLPFTISDIGGYSLNSPHRFVNQFFGELYLNYKRHYDCL